MRDNWREMAIADIACNKSRRFNFDKHDQVVFINTGDVYKGEFLHSRIEYKDGLPGQAKKAIKVGDILISEIRPANGRYLFVKQSLDNHVVSTKFMVVSVVSKLVDQQYLYNVLTSPNYVKEFQRIAESRSGTFPQITFDAISYLPVLLPPLSEQKIINEILGNIDDKIDLLRQQNATLEAMAQTLFRSWFVDFDPVIDNALDAGHPLPDALAARVAKRKRVRAHDHYPRLPEAVRRLFPDRFVFSEELGKWVPAGWAVKELKSIATNKKISVKPSDLNDNVFYIGLQDMPQKSIALESWSSAEDVASNKYRFHKGDFLFGKLRPYFHKVGIAPVDGVCSTDILVIHSKRLYNFAFVLGHLSSEKLIDHVSAAATGTRMPRTNWKEIGSYQFALPGEKVSTSFNTTCSGFYGRILSNIEEVSTLTKLRHTLLPPLISGKLSVENFAPAEEAVPSK